MVQPLMTSTLSTVVLIVGPACLRCELVERMKKLESEEGNGYNWLDQKKDPAGIGLMVDYMSELVDHRKPIDTATPQPEPIMRLGAIEKYGAFFPGS